MTTMIVKAASRAGAIMLAKGGTVGEIADEIGSTPELVWRSIRQHCLNAARAGKIPNIEPEHWLWQHEGDIRTIKVVRNKALEDTPRLRSGMSAGGNALKD